MDTNSANTGSSSTTSTCTGLPSARRITTRAASVSLGDEVTNPIMGARRGARLCRSYAPAVKQAHSRHTSGPAILGAMTEPAAALDDGGWATPHPEPRRRRVRDIAAAVAIAAAI